MSHKRLSLRRLFIALIALALMVPAVLMNMSAVMAQSTPQPTIGGRVIIQGHLVPALNHLKPLHVAQSNQQLQLSVALNLRNQDQLNQLLQDQNNPASPLYHQYLTPQQFVHLFGPTQNTVNQVTSYLRSQGLHVGTVSSNHTLIGASGSVATVEKAFNTSISDYNYNGRSVYAPTSEPSVPASLSGMIVNISGLDNVAHYRSLNRVLPARGPNGGYTPSELRTAYDINPLISNTDGSGQTTAIFELDGYTPSDITTYLNQFNLGPAKFSNVLVDGAQNNPGAGAIEVDLDLEVVSAIAPGATQKIYIGPNSTSGVNDTYNRIVTDGVAKVTSTSWGECESASGNSELSTLDNIFVQAAAQGQAIFAASGDAGAFDCGDTTLAVDSPADDPNVVGVGGTNLALDAVGNRLSESVWSTPGAGGRGPEGEGGGGGFSNFFTKPAYQTGPGVSSNNERQVPDVSADADPATGYAVFCTATAAGCNGWLVVGGTSAAAPLWAGIATDTNAFLSSQGKATLGNAHTDLYALFNTAQTFAAYHDITTGNNLNFNATAGYDVASGIGTPDAWNLARDLANVGGGNPTPTPTPTNTPTPNPTNTPTPNPTPTGTPQPTPTPNPGNLVVNSGFETGTLAGWTCVPGDAVVSSPVHSGSHALQINPSFTSTGECDQTIAVQPNHTYTLSAFVNGPFTFLGVQGGGETWTSNGSYAQLSESFTTSSSQTSVTIFVSGWFAQGSVFVDDVSLS